MVRIYYHIYAIDGVESIINEQISLIEKYFDFPYILNVGISIANENQSTYNIIEKFYKFNKPNYKIREVRAGGNEFTTIELIEKDKETFGESDYILYIHTKGASKQNDISYDNIISWRHLMNYYNIEKCKDVFKLFENTNFNSYGVLLSHLPNCKFYSGNFWWAKSNYIKTINLDSVYRDRFNAELNYIQCGNDWNPYSPYNKQGENHYRINFKREEYNI
jgi:hypothetical protein